MPDFIDWFKTIILVGDNFIDNDVHRRLLDSMHMTNEFMMFNSVLETINYFTLICEISINPRTEADLIILDLDIPIMDAWYFIELFKIVFTASFPNAKIIIISENFSEADIARMNSEKLVSGFIKKPLTSNKIIDCFKTSPAFRLDPHITKL